MKDHNKILQEIYNQLIDIFDTSEQAMYIYMDDEQKMCNERFASMLDYGSAKEWASVKGNFPTTFVAEESQALLIEAFQNAMERGIGSSTKIEWKKKSGGTVKTDVILVPISHSEHRMALHFISKSKN